MAGVKGRSGRKAFLDDKDTKEIIQMGLKACRDFFLSDTATLEAKADLGKHFVLRAIPQLVDVDAEGLATVINIIRVAENGHNSKELSGRVSILRSPISSNRISLGNGKESLPDITSS